MESGSPDIRVERGCERSLIHKYEKAPAFEHRTCRIDGRLRPRSQDSRKLEVYGPNTYVNPRFEGSHLASFTRKESG